MLKREDVRRSVNDSLARLQTDYIDLYLMHWPAPGATFENHEGMKEKNPEYRKLAWDELTELFKYAEFTIHLLKPYKFRALTSVGPGGLTIMTAIKSSYNIQTIYFL